MKVFICFVACLALAACAESCRQASEYWPQAAELVKQMTLEEKVGQMTQGDFPQYMDGNNVDQAAVKRDKLGSLLVGGNATPNGQGGMSGDQLRVDLFHYATPENWKALANEFYLPVEITKDDGKKTYVYPLLGTDAVHGNQHVVGSVLFPHNIGLAATHNPENFYDAGHFTAEAVKDSGFNYAFAPSVAVAHNPQWGRYYETMGSEPKEIREYARRFAQGVQGCNAKGDWTGVLGSTKHYIGDGATHLGIDEGITKVQDFKQFMHDNYQGYGGSIDAGIGNVMVSYSSINKVPMAINAVLTDGILKQGLMQENEHPFDGFVISDYDEAGKIAWQGYPTSNIKMELKDAIIHIINSGIDMMMLAETQPALPPHEYIRIMIEAIKEGEIPMDRVDEAVKRILAVKFELDLIKDDKPVEALKTESKIEEINASAYQSALRAAKESLVLLKNDNDVIPLNKKTLKYVFLVGERDIDVMTYDEKRIKTSFKDYDNIGAQNGGWTVRWQGFEGNEFFSGHWQRQAKASSIKDGIDEISRGFFSNHFKVEHVDYATGTEDQRLVQEKRNEFLMRFKDGQYRDANASNTVIVYVNSESPYSEFAGDINNPFCWNTTQWVEGCIYNAHVSPYLPDQQKTDLSMEMDQWSERVIRELKHQDSAIPIVSILFSGRPMLVENIMDESDAFIAAFLPGTAGGQAIAQALFGDYAFKSGVYENGVSNTLPVDWPRTSESLHDFPHYEVGKGHPRVEDPLFEIGAGLSTQLRRSEEFIN